MDALTKFRTYLLELKDQGIISKDQYETLTNLFNKAMVELERDITRYDNPWF